jgi:hypothetical protein
VSPLDATGYDGVEFWARGSGLVRFTAATVATTPTSNSGECQSGCYDAHGALVMLTPDWSLVRMPFVKLAQVRAFEALDPAVDAENARRPTAKQHAAGELLRFLDRRRRLLRRR